MVQIGPLDKSGPTVRFYASGDVVGQSVGGNYSTIRLRVEAWNTGTTASYYGGSGGQSSSIDSLGIAKVHEGNPFLPGGYANGQNRWNEFSDFNVAHNSAGYLGPLTLRMGILYASFNESYYATLYVARIPKVPPAPAPVGLDEITTTTMRYRFNSTGDGGSAITSWQIQYDDDPAFGSATIITSSGTSTLTPLNPGTTYYVRSRGNNAVGAGPWSSVSSATTLPADAPGLAIAPSLSGDSALITLSPPGGVSGVTEYNIEYRPSGGSTTATTTTTTTKLVTGLTPGQTYEWRANAEIAGYTSPWTGWTPVAQPNPNTNPGDYFDGSTAARPDATYSWVGSANNSQSISTGVGATGWSATFGSPTAGTLSRVTGGLSGSYSARVVFTRSATAAGQWSAGQSVATGYRSDVEGSTTYTGSVYVKVADRSQRLAAQITWMDAAGSAIGSPVSGAVVVAASNTWTRLSVVAAVAPSTAAFASVRVVDVAGTGFSIFLAGQSLQLDNAMITLGGEVLPYFDGSTADGGGFVYAWDGTANASVSSRTQVTAVVTDPLADPDCPPFPTPPLPPVIPSDCIDEIGEWRRYMVQVQAIDVPLWGAVLPTLVLNTDSIAERQVRIRYYPNFEGVAPEFIDTTEWEAELILTYIPPNTELTLDGVTQRVWAAVAGAAPVAGDRLLYGTGGVPATWPELTCGVGYVVTLDVPLDAPSGNLSTRVLLTQRV